MDDDILNSTIELPLDFEKMLKKIQALATIQNASAVDALEPQSVFGAYFKDIHSYITILDMGTMEESNKAWTFLLTAYYNTLGIKHRQSSIGENSYGTLNSPVLPLLGQFINCSQKKHYLRYWLRTWIFTFLLRNFLWLFMYWCGNE